MDTVSKLATELKNFTSRSGLALLTLLLFADVYSAVTLKLPLLDACAAWSLTPKTAVLVLVGLGLFRPLSRLAAVSLRVTVCGVGSVLHNFRRMAYIAETFDGLLGLDGDGACERRLTSTELVNLALSGCAPALAIYNERERRDRDRAEVADYCLAFLAMVVASALVGGHSVVMLGWSTLASAIRPGPAAAVLGIGAWMLLLTGVPAPDTSSLEYILSKALPGASEPSPVERPRVRAG